MLAHLLASLEPLNLDPVVVVTGEDMEAVAETAAPHPTAVQSAQLGTGHAVMAARENLAGFTGDVLVLFGDSPLVAAETLQAMLAAHESEYDAAIKSHFDKHLAAFVR